MKRVILIGYMGAGKTTLGRILARELNLEFIDLDLYIEQRYRKTVAQIFEEKGEKGFRQIEQSMLHEAAEFENVLLAAGGGTPCFFDNMQYMNEQAVTIYLKAAPETLLAHLRMSKGKRPLIIGKNDEELLAYIKDSLERREPYYNEAKCIFEIAPLDTDEAIGKASNRLKEFIEAYYP